MLFDPTDLAALCDQLEGWLRDQPAFGPRSHLRNPRRPSAGFSNETILFELARSPGTEEETLVLRAEPHGVQIFPTYDLGLQYHVMRALADSPVPVPETLAFCADQSVLGREFFLMRAVAGEVPPDVPPYHAAGMCRGASPARRRTLWWNGVEAMAAVHRLDPAEYPLDCLSGKRAGEPGNELERYEHFLHWATSEVPHPIAAEAFEWLRANQPDAGAPSLCWGDARLPNLMYRGDEVVAVLDWEMAHLGDPRADLAWWLFLDWHHSEGNRIPRLAGFPSPAETIDRWEDLTGRRAGDLRWFEVWAAFRFSLMMFRVGQHMRRSGTPMPNEDFDVNNPASRRLAALLDLDPPGPAVEAEIVKDADAEVRVQVSLSGRDAHDWYAAVSSGIGVRHEGRTKNPDVFIGADADDWAGIQKGEIDRTQAFLGGKLEIVGDISVMMRLEALMTALSLGGPGTTYYESDGVAGVTTGTVAAIEDDQRHMPGPDSLPWWSESFWFAFYDPNAELGIVIRSGAYPNRHEANVYIVVSHRGEVVHSYVDSCATLPAFETAHLAMANGLTLCWEEPLRSFRLQYEQDALQLDLKMEGMSPAYLYPPPPNTTVDQVARHIEQGGTATGSVRIGAKTFGFDGSAHRDHTFGGERDWSKFWRWNYLSGEFGREFWFNAVRIRFAPDLPEIHIGCVWNGERTLGLREIDIDLETRDGGTRPASVSLRMTDDEGQVHLIRSDEILALCPAQHGRTWIKDTFVRYRRGSEIGYGILELGYVEGEPIEW